jgi:hypothetical protein
MKFSARLFSVLVVVLLMAVPFSVLAQGENPACTGLSAEDCEFLVTAGDNVGTATSFAIPAMSVNFTLNTGEAGAEPTVFSVTGSGEVMLPQSGRMLLHLTFDNITMQPSEEELPEQFELLVLDNMVYANQDGEWFGEEIEEDDLAELEELLGQTNSLALSDLGSSGMDLTGVLTTTRGADMEAMGMNMAVYTMDVNITSLLTTLLSSPALGEMLGATGEDMGMSEMTPEDLQMMGMILGPMLQGTTINVEQWFGTEDQYLHHLGLNVNINLNLGMFGEADTPPITGALNVSLDLDQVNETFDITAPTEFRPMDEMENELEGLTEGLGL